MRGEGVRGSKGSEKIGLQDHFNLQSSKIIQSETCAAERGEERAVGGVLGAVNCVEGKRRRRRSCRGKRGNERGIRGNRIRRGGRRVA